MAIVTDVLVECPSIWVIYVDLSLFEFVDLKIDVKS